MTWILEALYFYHEDCEKYMGHVTSKLFHYSNLPSGTPVGFTKSSKAASAALKARAPPSANSWANIKGTQNSQGIKKQQFIRHRRIIYTSLTLRPLPVLIPACGVTRFLWRNPSRLDESDLWPSWCIDKNGILLPANFQRVEPTPKGNLDSLSRWHTLERSA